MKPYSQTTTYTGDTNEGTNEKIRDIKFIMRPNLNRSDRLSPYSPTARAAAKSRIRYDAAEQALQSALRGDIKLLANDASSDAPLPYSRGDKSTINNNNGEYDDYEDSVDNTANLINPDAPPLDANLMLSVLFQYYCRFGKGSNHHHQNDENGGGGGGSEGVDLLDLANFAKFTRDSNEVAGLLEGGLNPTEVDLLFIKVRKHHPRKIRYDEWLQVLSAMSSYKYGDLTIDPSEAFAHFLNKFVFTVPAAVCIARSIRSNLVKVEPIVGLAGGGGGGGASSSSSSAYDNNLLSTSSSSSLSLHNHYRMPTGLSVVAPPQEKKESPLHHSASNSSLVSNLRAGAGPFSAAAVAVGISPSAVRGRRLVPEHGHSAHQLLQSGLLTSPISSNGIGGGGGGRALNDGYGSSLLSSLSSSSSSSSSKSAQPPPLPSSSSYVGSPRVAGVPDVVAALPGYEEALRKAAYEFAQASLQNGGESGEEGKKEDDDTNTATVSPISKKPTISIATTTTNSLSSSTSSSSSSPRINHVAYNSTNSAASPNSTSSDPYRTRLSAVSMPAKDPTDPATYLTASQRSLAAVHRMVPPSDAFQLLQRMAVDIYSKQKAAAAASTSASGREASSSTSSSSVMMTAMNNSNTTLEDVSIQVPGAFSIPTSISPRAIADASSSSSFRVGRPFSPSLSGPSGAELLGLSKTPSFRIATISAYDFTSQQQQQGGGGGVSIGSDGQPILSATDFTYSPRPVSVVAPSSNNSLSDSRLILSSYSSSSPRSARQGSSSSSMVLGGGGGGKSGSPRPRMGEPGFRPSVAGEDNVPGGLLDRLSSPSNFTGVYKIGYRSSQGGYGINHYSDKAVKNVTGLTSDPKTNESVHDFSSILRPAVVKDAPKGPFRP